MDKETFEKDVAEYTGPLSHISREVSDPKLDDLDKLYGVTSRLSAQNREKHRKIIWCLATTGTLLALFFLIYDSATVYYLILACIIALGFLYGILRYADTLKCHEKYLEYRLLAESLRVQFFLSIAAIETPVTDLLPWFIIKGIDWIDDAIGKQPVLPKEEKKPILDFWIKDQIKYHTSAIEKKTKQLKRQKIVSKTAIIITVATFFITLVFEFWMANNPGEINNATIAALLNIVQSHGTMIGYDQTEFIRAILKIIIGTMSAATLFIGSYYGKMSLSDSIDDHKRMKELYEFAENQMGPEEDDALILWLAREFLIENSTWYSYQNQNKAEFVF